MKIIVGLGNPGVKYVKNRHNVGYLFLDFLRQSFDFEEFKEKSKFKSLVTEGELNGEKIILVKPLTFMNNSGQAVTALESFYKVGFENFCICYDDVDLVFPATRFRLEGSAGTHNGMRSVIELTGTQNIPRMRFGVDSEMRKGALTDFVLGNFTETELGALFDIFTKAKIEMFNGIGLG